MKQINFVVEIVCQEESKTTIIVRRADNGAIVRITDSVDGVSSFLAEVVASAASPVTSNN